VLLAAAAMSEAGRRPESLSCQGTHVIGRSRACVVHHSVPLPDVIFKIQGAKSIETVLSTRKGCCDLAHSAALNKLANSGPYLGFV
jgi:hypothetical protein